MPFQTRSASLAAAILLALSQAVQIGRAAPKSGAVGYKTWHNESYNFRIDLPFSILKDAGPPPAGQGRKYTAQGGDFRLVVFTLTNQPVASPDQECDQQIAKIPGGALTTYRRVTPDWYVFSARSKGSAPFITYEKVLRRGDERDVVMYSDSVRPRSNAFCCSFASASGDMFKVIVMIVSSG